METDKNRYDISGKLIDMGRMLDLIKAGDRVFLSSGPATPAESLNAIMNSRKKNILDLEIIQLITMNELFSQEQTGDKKYRLKTFSIGESITRRIQEGEVDFFPANLIEIPYLFSTGAVEVDVAIITTTPPDERGFLNLGIAVDVAAIVISRAKTVIVEINPNMPNVYGETSIHVNQVHYIVEGSMPLPERERKEFDKTRDKIGWHISNLIEDGSTIALHVGRIFDAIAHHLHGKKNIGIFTNVISDWVIELVESGVISINRSRHKGGLVTTSYCFGTRKLYEYVNHNPMFEFHPISRLAHPFNISRIKNLVSIMNVKKIDISGESVIFHSGDNLLSGYESKFNFALGAAFARNGKSVVSLMSVDQEGKSNIVVAHDEEYDRVRATLGAIRYVVTEYGAANIFGKSIRERVLSMIDIAHPDHREALLQTAKERGYIYPDQIYVARNAENYPVNLETVKSFGDIDIKFRPVKPSDEDMMRRLVYSFSDEGRMMRFFIRIPAMTHEDMQKYVNIDYNDTMSIVGVQQKSRIEHIIAEGRYMYLKKSRTYEMAFAVDETYQNRGIATFLCNCLIAIAASKGIKQLSAVVLPENRKMIKVFQKAAIKPDITYTNGQVEIRFKLNK